ncbi:MAG: DUF2341 domain-containing protein [Promethearchaeota archaeon]
MAKLLRRLCCLVLVFLLCVSFTQVTAAASIQESQWAYKKSHTIVGSTAGALTNYQMRFFVHYGSGTDTGADVYCDSKCRTDFDDIRFTDSTGNLLDYWIESKTDGDEAIFWVEINNIAASPSTTTIWMFLDNPGASSESNGETTFLLFDDFIGSSLDLTKWDVMRDGSYSVSSGILTMPGNDEVLLWTDSKYSTGVAIVFSLLCESNGYQGEIGMADQDPPTNLISITGYTEPPPEFTVYAEDEGGSDYTSGHTWDSAWNSNYHDYQMIWLVDTSFHVYQDNLLEETMTSYIPDSSPALFVFVYTDGLGSSSQDMFYDWIFVRKYVDPEPSHGEWGALKPTEATGGMCLGTITVVAIIGVVAVAKAIHWKLE